MKRLSFFLLASLWMGMISFAQAEEKILYVYNWAEYMPKAVLKQFTKKTGIDIKYSTFDSNEAMYAKVKTTGGSAYDVIVPSTYLVSKMAKEGMLEKIDKQQLPNFKWLDPKLLDKEYDPHNEYSIPYLWGTTGISYHRGLVKQPIERWVDLWQPEFRNRVLLTDDMRDVFGLALKTLGYSANSKNEKEIEAAYEKLKTLRPNVKMFYSESPKQVYLNEEVWLGMNFNGEAFIAAQENENMAYVYPKEGAMIWVDSLVIPKGAKHPQNAHQFINFLLEPEVAKIISEEVGYAVPNQKTLELLKKEVRENRIVYPSEDDLKNGEFQIDVGEALKVYEKYWERLKAGS